MKKKVVKVIREFEDGSREYIDGESVENFIKFESAAYTIAHVHRIKQDKVEWKKEII